MRLVKAFRIAAERLEFLRRKAIAEDLPNKEESVAKVNAAKLWYAKRFATTSTPGLHTHFLRILNYDQRLRAL